MTSQVNFDIRALERRARNSWRDVDVAIQAPRPTVFERVRAAVAYGTVAAVVGWAVFYVTPSHAAGAMAHDVNRVTASPSFVYFGDTREGRKAQADIMRDDNRAARQTELENLKFQHERALAADKAYYEKLKDQRKHK